MIKMSQRIAIIGSGAIGGYLAAQAYQAGHDVTFCVRTPFSQFVYVNSRGEKQELSIQIATSPEQVKPFPWVFLTTKIQDTASTEPWLKQLTDANSTVVVVQNGLEHVERVSPLAPQATILPGVINCAAERIRPGYVKHYDSNILFVPQGEKGKALCLLLKGSEVDCRLTDDFATVAWRKLFSNIVANAITAITMQRIEVIKDPGIRRLGRGLLEEALSVARAEGVDLPDQAVEATLQAIDQYDPRQGSSMMYDRLAGKPTEHHYLNGIVVRKGGEHSIPTPLNAKIVQLLDTPTLKLSPDALIEQTLGEA
jgi:2-dehydropantoate 2-reductase